MACCRNHYRKAQEQLVVEAAVDASGVFKSPGEAKLTTQAAWFFASTDVPEWKQSEASEKLQSMSMVVQLEGARENALLEWKKFAAIIGRSESIQPHPEQLAVNLALAYMEHGQTSGATAALAALELWSVDSHHQRMGLNIPFMVNEKIKAMANKAVQDECQTSLQERKGELKDHEPTMWDVSMTPQHLQKCKQSKQKQEGWKLISPAKYSKWMGKSSPCKDFSFLKPRTNQPAMFAVQE